MKTVSISQFKVHCLRLVEEVRSTGESIEVTKRGKAVAVVSPPPRNDVDWRPGAFRDQIRILGNISDLGIEWEAMK